MADNYKIHCVMHPACPPAVIEFKEIEVAEYDLEKKEYKEPISALTYDIDMPPETAKLMSMVMTKEDFDRAWEAVKELAYKVVKRMKEASSALDNGEAKDADSEVQ